MVRSLIIQTVTPGPCRILYAQIYGSDAHGDKHGQTGSLAPQTSARGLQKEQVAAVARQVQSECSFQLHCAASDPVGEEVRRHLSQEEGAIVPQTGTFQMPPGELFGSKTFAVWQTAGNCGLSLVCDSHENRQQAAAALSQIFKLLKLHLRVLHQPDEVLQKPEKVAAILHHFLPQGQLLFLNSRAVRHKEKELELMLSGK
ncbi:PREDICTED: AP-5 complex subunit sigma-1-like [Branchiostoma belcheri]|uniref:AP-5 complex subunit sigma-1-like n=1 Tax=Branchiostoma belcheri TaxID=7741 RepID=A0A6P5AI54_BRABE|nr:PREDICTED: AP-5 complex subunit sigma-1-like [Branchiostoma belcheri]